MSERTQVLKFGGLLVGVLAAGLVAGFLLLRGDGGSPSIKSPETSTPAPTPTDVRAQVEQAYLHAWDVWAESLIELDPSRLPEILTGRALRTIQQQLERQVHENQPVRLSADHNYRIVVIDEATASVNDRYVSHTVRVNPDTLEPIEADPRQQLHTSFTMKLVDGRWKIAEIIKQDV